MKRSTSRILTTHAGSLIRPESIASFDRSRQQGWVDEKAYDKALQQAVKDVVRKQAETGINVVDDGEFSKSSWGTYINSRVTGFQHDPERDMAINYTGQDSERFAGYFDAENGGQARRRWRGADVCVEPIVYVDNHSIHRDIANLSSAAAWNRVEDAFLPVVAPASAAFNGVQ